MRKGTKMGIRVRIMQVLSIGMPEIMAEAVAKEMGVAAGTIITMVIGTGMVGLVGEFQSLFWLMESLFLPFRQVIQRL